VFFFPFGGGMFAMLVQEGFFWCSIVGALLDPIRITQLRMLQCCVDLLVVCDVCCAFLF
jgi:hypothetical protein